MVDVKGVDARDCKAWRELIGSMDEEFVVWSRTFRRVHGVEDARPQPPSDDADDDQDEDFGEPDEVCEAAE